MVRELVRARGSAERSRRASSGHESRLSTHHAAVDKVAWCTGRLSIAGSRRVRDSRWSRQRGWATRTRHDGVEEKYLTSKARRSPGLRTLVSVAACRVSYPSPGEQAGASRSRTSGSARRSWQRGREPSIPTARSPPARRAAGQVNPDTIIRPGMANQPGGVTGVDATALPIASHVGFVCPLRRRQAPHVTERRLRARDPKSTKTRSGPVNERSSSSTSSSSRPAPSPPGGPRRGWTSPGLASSPRSPQRRALRRPRRQGAQELRDCSAAARRGARPTVSHPDQARASRSPTSRRHQRRQHRAERLARRAYTRAATSRMRLLGP